MCWENLSLWYVSSSPHRRTVTLTTSSHPLANLGLKAPLSFPRLNEVRLNGIIPEAVQAIFETISAPELATIGVWALEGEFYRSLISILNILSPTRFPHFATIQVEDSAFGSVVKLVEMTRSSLSDPRTPRLLVLVDRATALTALAPPPPDSAAQLERWGRIRGALESCADVEWPEEMDFEWSGETDQANRDG